MINGDIAFDSKEIINYNRRRGIKSNIPTNSRNAKRKKRGRTRKLDKEIYRERNAVERFFSWIEAYKKISPRYERSEISYIGIDTLSCIIVICRVLG